MRKLLNTLFVTSEDAYLTIDGENVVVNREKQEVARFPLHTLSGIISFSYAGASPALMGGCARRGVSLTIILRAIRQLCAGSSAARYCIRRSRTFPFSSPTLLARNRPVGVLISITASCRAEIFRLPTAVLSS